MENAEVTNKFAQRGTRPEAGTVEPATDASPAGVNFSVEMLAGLKTAPVSDRFDERVSMETSAPVAPVPAPRELALEVTKHVAELKQLNLDSLAVVLKPDANTELFLHLKRHLGGGVEIQAQFERGDFTRLSAHWDELQSTLAAQGVRLSALEAPPATSNFDSSRPPLEQHEGGSPRQDSEQRGQKPAPEPFQEFLSGPPAKPAFRRAQISTQPSASRPWETWA